MSSFLRDPGLSVCLSDPCSLTHWKKEEKKKKIYCVSVCASRSTSSKERSSYVMNMSSIGGWSARRSGADNWSTIFVQKVIWTPGQSMFSLTLSCLLLGSFSLFNLISLLLFFPCPVTLALLATAALICGPLLLVTGLDEKRHRAECQMWSKLENKTLPLQDKGHANCTTNEECTGFKCVGVYQVSNLWSQLFFEIS